MNRLSIVIAIAALVLAGSAGLWFGRSRPTPTSAPVSGTVAETSHPTERTLTVHVSGAVVHPGLVEVADPARVADVIVAAGGALPDAKLGSVNLAAFVADGQHLDVPSTDVRASVGSTGKVAINQADAATLEQLPGVGPVLAERIFEYRQAHGPFQTVEDLLDVPGIGESKLAALRDAVSVP